MFDTTDVMHLNRTFWFGALLLAGALTLVQAQDNANGVWRIHTVRPDGSTDDVFLNLLESGTSVSGEVIENYGHKKIREGSFVQGKLHAEINPWRQIIETYEGRLVDGNLDLIVSRKENPTSEPSVTKATAERSSEEATRPPAKLPTPALGSRT